MPWELLLALLAASKWCPWILLALLGFGGACWRTMAGTLRVVRRSDACVVVECFSVAAQAQALGGLAVVLIVKTCTDLLGWATIVRGGWPSAPA